MRWLTTAFVVLLSLGLSLPGDLFTARSQTPEPEPNLNFEFDVAPQDEKPDGWVILAQGAELEYKRGSAAAGRWCVVLKNTKPEQWVRIGLLASMIAKPNTWYKLRYWALARGDSVRFGWRLASADLKETSDALDSMEEVQAGSGKWRLNQTRAFKLTDAQIERYPLLAFCLDAGPAGSVDLDDIAISRSAPD
jgi:hypothetical protein